MIRLILFDLVGHARVWLGTLAVTIATGFIAALAAGLIETGTAYGGQVQEGLGSASSAVIIFTTVTALIVLSSTANLAVALQQRSYALWQLVGIRPLFVGLVILAQLGIVGVVGALIGCLLAFPVLDPLLTWVFHTWDDMHGISFHLSAVSVFLVTVTVAVIVVFGGIRGASRASRTQAIEVLRDPEPSQSKMGWARFSLTAGALAAIVGLTTSMNGASFSQIAGQSIMLTPLIAGFFAGCGPILFPLVLRTWTVPFPSRASASWFLARHSARYRLSQSSAAISPLMVAIALAAGLYTAGATLAAAVAVETGSAEGFELAPEGVVLMLGGPLLLSAIVAAATVLMSGHAREREFALIQAAGSTQTVIVLTAIWEAIIYTVTAAILGVTATVLGGLIIAIALNLAFPTVSFATIGLLAGGGFVLILAATVVPTVAALRHNIPHTLAVE